MEKKSKYSYLAKNTILFTISSFGSKLLSFLLVPLYTAVLTTEDYGTADLISTTASLLTFAFTINIADSVLRFAIDRKDKQEEILNFGLKVLSIGSIVLAMVLVVFKHYSLIKWEDYCYLFLFLTFFLSSLNGILSNYLRAIDKVSAVAISGIILSVVMIGCNLLFLLVFRLGIIGYILSSILGTLSSIAYTIIVLRKKIFVLFKSHCDKQTKIEMCKYSVPLIFNGIAWWMNSCIDKYFLTIACGVGINGIYAVSQKIPSILSMFNTIFGQAWNLSAIKEYDNNDGDGFFSNTYKMYNASLVVICSALILINIPLAKILFSDEFFGAWKYSSLLLISMIFSSMSSFVGSIFAAVKKSKIFAISTVIAAIVNMTLNAVLIPQISALGASIATAISFFCVWFIRFVCARRFIHMKINLLKDFIVYTLLITQVIFEHMESHFYLGQVAIFITIVLLYRKTIWKVIKMVIIKSNYVTNFIEKKGGNT